MVVEEQIARLKRKCLSRQNGVTVENMEKAGIRYQKSFGVAYPELKEMARFVEPSQELAMACWKSNIRELMILATMVYPKSEISIDLTKKLEEGIVNIEIAEHLAFNLLSYSEEVVSVLFSWLEETNLNKQMAAIHGLAWALRRKNESVRELFTEKQTSILPSLQYIPKALFSSFTFLLKEIGSINSDLQSRVFTYCELNMLNKNDLAERLKAELELHFRYSG